MILKSCSWTQVCDSNFALKLEAKYSFMLGHSHLSGKRSMGLRPQLALAGQMMQALQADTDKGGLAKGNMFRAHASLDGVV